MESVNQRKFGTGSSTESKGRVGETHNVGEANRTRSSSNSTHTKNTMNTSTNTNVPLNSKISPSFDDTNFTSSLQMNRNTDNVNKSIDQVYTEQSTNDLDNDSIVDPNTNANNRNTTRDASPKSMKDTATQKKSGTIGQSTPIPISSKVTSPATPSIKETQDNSSTPSGNSGSWIGSVLEGMRNIGHRKSSVHKSPPVNSHAKPSASQNADDVVTPPREETKEGQSSSSVDSPNSKEKIADFLEMNEQEAYNRSNRSNSAPESYPSVMNDEDLKTMKSQTSFYTKDSQFNIHSPNPQSYAHASEESAKTLLDMVIREKTFSLSFVNLQIIPPLLLESSDVQSNLEILHLEFCGVTTIPVDIINFMKLKSLNLSHNRIVYIPEEIVNLKDLTTINLYSNNIEMIPDLNGLNLKYLNIGGNHLTELPESLFDLYDLEYFNIANNRLKVLSANISRLVNLVELHIEDNLLTALPGSICQLHNLVHLSVNRNRLTKLPVDFHISLPKLKDLNLSRNCLDSHSLERLAKMTQLRAYLFGSNRITEIPENTSCFDVTNIEIRMVDFSNNYISVFPKEIRRSAKTLIHLDLRNNRIQEINKGIKYLVHLRKLDLSRNKLKFIPNYLSNLINVQILKLSHNEIEVIDQQAFFGCKELEELHLDHNYLEKLPKSISSCKKLARLLLEYNRLKQLPESIAECQLYHLDVSHNQLVSLPQSIGQCTMIRKLLINDNLIEQNPYAIIQLTSLEFLNCTNNPFMKGFHKKHDHGVSEKVVARNLSETLEQLDETYPQNPEYYEWLTQKLESSNGEQSFNEILELPGTQPLTCSIQ